MKRHLCLLVFGPLVVGCLAQTSPPAGGQTGDITRASGEVTAVNAAAHEIVLKPDSGGAVTVKLTDKTLYLRVPLGEKDLKKAAPTTLKDISAGDRVLVRGEPGTQANTLAAVSVIVMTKADLAQKYVRDRAEWMRRSMAGTVTTVDADKNEIAMSMQAREGAKTVVVELSGATQYRRYAPDSVKFSDAKPSTLAEIRTGDQLRALGDKNEDGTRVKAEEIVSGAFRTFAATVISADPAAGTLQVTDLQTRKPVTVHLKEDTMSRRLSEMAVTMLARRFLGGAPAGVPPAPAGPGRGQFDLQQMLERMPPLNVAELKKGDALVISGSRGQDPANVMALTMLAGVEPLLAAAPRQAGGAVNIGNWSLDVGMPME